MKVLGSSVLLFFAAGELDTHFQHDGSIYLEDYLLTLGLYELG